MQKQKFVITGPYVTPPQKFVITGPYVTPPQKLSSGGGLEALRKAADEEYLRAGNVFIPVYSEGRRTRSTGFSIAVIKGPPPPPHIINQVAAQGDKDEKAEIEIEIEGEVTQDELMDEPSEHSAGIC